MQAKKIFILLFFLLTSISAKATLPYYDQHETGWHWYKDPVINKPNKPQKPKTATQQLAALKSQAELALAKAILTPTKQNVRNYIALQNQISFMSERFSTVWQQVLLESPRLNYQVTHPTLQAAKEAVIEKSTQEDEGLIANLAEHSGLFFFYRSTCPYCQRFAPILKRFATYYHFPLVAITTNGKKLAKFPNSKNDTGQAKRFGVEVEPALYLVNPYREKVIPVSMGLVSYTTLKNRLIQIAKNTGGRQ